MAVVAKISDLKERGPKIRLNAVCPYFTMFPLDFPLRVLANANPDARVLLSVVAVRRSVQRGSSGCQRLVST